jgi:hypothetical protein
LLSGLIELKISLPIFEREVLPVLIFHLACDLQN